MSDIVIRAEGLGKKYLIGSQTGKGTSYTALRDIVARGAQNALSKVRDMILGRPIVEGNRLEEVWALRDIDFRVRRGEVVGIIGRNGAGKSTLLKILSRITEPTEGRVTIHGRVSSLLEVGTGFHPELTGRENIFLNGAILGMPRVEISRKLDEIVAFAGVGRYLDTPVKRYSSGMHVRLAFAVAAHLEPDVLILDEVLAVGDAEFQRRCTGKMSEVAKGGRTVLIVSHNMGVIQALCERAILLDGGRIELEGASQECVSRYLTAVQSGSVFRREGKGAVSISRVEILDSGGQGSSRARVEIDVYSKLACKVSVDVRLSEGGGLPVGYGSLGTLKHADLVALEVGSNRVVFSFSTNGLANGDYFLSLDLTIPFREHLDRVERCASFSVHGADLGDSDLALEQKWGYGSITIPLTREAVASD